MASTTQNPARRDHEVAEVAAGEPAVGAAHAPVVEHQDVIQAFQAGGDGSLAGAAGRPGPLVLRFACQRQE